jgi:hypothetical protein
MKRRLLLIGIGLVLVLLAVGGWTVQAFRSPPSFRRNTQPQGE